MLLTIEAPDPAVQTAWRSATRGRGHVVALSRWAPAPLDILDPRCMKLVRGWIRGGLVQAVWMRLPSDSLSQSRNRDACAPPLRTATAVRGVLGLCGRELLRVQVANGMIDNMTYIFTLCREMRVSACLECPRHHWSWSFAVIRRLQTLANVHEVDYDLCRYGSSSLRAMRLLHVHSDMLALTAECNCQRPHRERRERGGGHGQFFWNAAALILSDGLKAQQLRILLGYGGGTR